MRTLLRSGALSAALAATLVLSGCGADEPDAAPAAEASAAADAAPALAIGDSWIKATDTEMTAAFGVLTNSSDEDVVIESASTDVAGLVELHEVVEKDGQMVMQPKAGGISVPAGGEHLLEPGGDHVMLMDLQRALEPGEEIPVTLSLSNGQTLEFTAVVKEFSGAEEDYMGDMSEDMGGMDMGGESEDSHDHSEDDHGDSNHGDHDH
ncbi:hypothetical protein GCM10027425_07580 [Alteromonas gracilis]